MALVTLPRQYTADISGNPRVGARLFVYDAGTNNTRIVYTTKAYTTELLQPISSTEAGTFPAIYVNPAGGDYKIVIQDDTGALIYSEDNLSPSIDALTSALISTTLDSLKRTPTEVAVGQIPVNTAYAPGNIRRWGAPLNGIDDDAPAIRLALNAVPIDGGCVFCDPPGKILVKSVIYIPQRISGAGFGVEIDFEGCAIDGNGGQIFESGKGVTSTASNFLETPESTSSLHYGTHIHGGKWTNYTIALKLFNFVQGCRLSNIQSSAPKTLLFTSRCFYLHLDNVNVNSATLALTDVIFDFGDEINTMTFSNVHAGGAGTQKGIGYRFNSAVKGMSLAGLGAEGLDVGYKFLGVIFGCTLANNFIEANTTAISFATQAVAFIVEGNYFNGNTNAIVANNWQSGRWGHNEYESGANAVNLSGTGNYCDVFLPPNGFPSSGTGNHTNWSVRPSNWTLNPACRAYHSDFIYDTAVGFNSPIATLEPVDVGSIVPHKYTGNGGVLFANLIPFCATSLQNTNNDLRVDTKIAYGAGASARFDVQVVDGVSTYVVSGRVVFGNSVFRDDATAKTVVASNNGGLLRLTIAGFSTISSYIGSVRIV